MTSGWSQKKKKKGGVKVLPHHIAGITSFGPHISVCVCVCVPMCVCVHAHTPC